LFFYPIGRSSQLRKCTNPRTKCPILQCNISQT
jgi:hypothetical protein